MISNKWKLLHEQKTDTPDPSTSEIIKILLGNRGISSEADRKEFLNPSLEVINPEKVQINVKEVDKTLKRIKKAIDSGEKIIIYGDYDVDGICGSAILWETIFSHYKNVMPHIPHRMEEGYGLSVAGIDHIVTEHGSPGLIITVDNGIVAYDAVDYANSKGIDVIITDHHVVGDKTPDAYSIVHTTNLCGAGVAYLLSREIEKNLFKDSQNRREDHLELVALATIADLVPLIGASRAFAKYGIEALRKTKRPGLNALIDDAKLKKEDIGTYEIGHMIAPRLNATGRVAHAMDSLRLLCTKDVLRAKKLSMHLSETNKNRQLLTEESTTHADSITAEAVADKKLIFVADAKYNQGVIGLVASRLVEKYYLPSVVVSIGEKFSKGSARSVSGFNIIEFLRTQSNFLVDAGGHPMAAGFTIETDKIESFRAAIIESSQIAVSPELLDRVLTIDMELNFSVIDLDFEKELGALSPFGMKSPEPVFLTRGVKIKKLGFVGRDKKHLKLLLTKDERQFEAILFGVGETELKAGDSIDAVYKIARDEWDGNSKILLRLKDLSPSAN